MTNVKTILESYERTGSYRKTACEVGVSHNTVRRYILRAQAAREGKIDAIVPETREIIQPCRVVTDEIRGKIHRILENNRHSEAARPADRGAVCLVRARWRRNMLDDQVSPWRCGRDVLITARRFRAL